MRPIDADQVIETMKAYPVHSTFSMIEENRGRQAIHNVWLAAIETAETLDTVSVVRCKDCVHWFEDHQRCEHHSIMDVDGTWLYSLFTEPDYFCADGERREDDAKDD